MTKWSKKRITGAVLLSVIFLYATCYLGTSTLEDRKVAMGSFGGLAGERYSRHFQTQPQCLAFLPLLWMERVLRGGRLDVTIESEAYDRIIWLF